MRANVSVGGEVSESFGVTNGIKQGCVLAHTLFSIFLSAMLDEAFRHMGDGVYIQSRQNTDLFNVAQFRAKTKTIRILMRELLFVDDSTLVAHSAEEMQKIVDAFSDVSKKFGLKINIKKTEVLYQPNSTRTREEDSMVDGNKNNCVLEFTYLGSTISSNGCIDDETQRGVAKASASFGRLRQRLWNNHHASMRAKGKIYRAIVLFTLLYGAEAWTVYIRQVKKLHAFMMRHLRSIMGITWMDKVTHKEILERTGSLLSTVFWSQKERAPSSPVQGYHQEKPETERHKDRLMGITLAAERQMESISQVMEAVFVASRPTA